MAIKIFLKYGHILEPEFIIKNIINKIFSDHKL